MPPTTPYEVDLEHSYWDKQYAQAEYGTQMLYPHGHHNMILEDEANEDDFLALYGASELFG